MKRSSFIGDHGIQKYDKWARILDGIENDVSLKDDEALELAIQLLMDVISFHHKGSDKEFFPSSTT